MAVGHGVPGMITPAAERQAILILPTYDEPAADVVREWVHLALVGVPVRAAAPLGSSGGGARGQRAPARTGALRVATGARPDAAVVAGVRGGLRTWRQGCLVVRRWSRAGRWLVACLGSGVARPRQDRVGRDRPRCAHVRSRGATATGVRRMAAARVTTVAVEVGPHASDRAAERAGRDRPESTSVTCQGDGVVQPRVVRDRRGPRRGDLAAVQPGT